MTLHYILAFIHWDVNPDIFVIPGLNHPIRWYGVLWAVALVSSQLIMSFIYKKEGRSDKEVDLMTLYIVLGAILGARLGHVLFYDPDYYLAHPTEILSVWEGGLASHGGTIGILLTAWWFTRKTKVPYLWLLDRLAIVSALCACLIRVGNLMNSEMIGTQTNKPWGFIFSSIDEAPRHPAQLYEAFGYLIVFLLTYWIWANKRATLQNGTLLGWFLIALFGIRLIVEHFKMDQEAFEEGMLLNMGQILSIPFVLGGIVILFLTRSNANAIAKDVKQ